MKLSSDDTQRIITALLNNQDHRTLILALINAQFLEYAIDFFIKIAEAKMRNHPINDDWYRREFVTNEDLSTTDIIINAGLNKKTVDNIYKTSNRKLVLEIAPTYYDELLGVIQNLTTQDDSIDLMLTIKLKGVSADAIFARQSAVFIADKLSDMNKSQSESLNIHWVELSAPSGYHQFYDVLQKLNIPSKPFSGDLESALETIFATLFS